MQKSKYFSLSSLLLVALLSSGCTGQSDEAQSVVLSTQPAVILATEVSPPITPSASVKDTSSLTSTPTALPTSTLTPTDTPTLTVTPTQSAADAYRVSYVVEGDVLNVRSGPDVNFDILAGLPPNATGVKHVLTQTEEDWVEITWQDASGWVNRYFLTEDVTSEAFCNDPAARNVVNAFRTALAERDGSKLVQLIHPRRGLLVRLNWWNTEVRFSQPEIQNLFTEAKDYDWGYEDGSGMSIEGPFHQVVLPILDKDFSDSPQIHCNDLAAGGTAGIKQLPFEYRAINYYAIYRPAQDNEMDWGTWVLGIEYWSGKPYLSFLVHYQWEI